MRSRPPDDARDGAPVVSGRELLDVVRDVHHGRCFASSSFLAEQCGWPVRISAFGTCLLLLLVTDGTDALIGAALALTLTLTSAEVVRRACVRRWASTLAHAHADGGTYDVSDLIGSVTADRLLGRIDGEPVTGCRKCDAAFRYLLKRAEASDSADA